MNQGILSYQCKRSGMLIGVLALATLILVALCVFMTDPVPYLVALMVVLVIGVNLYQLETVVDHHSVWLVFGVGFFKTEISRSSIESSAVVENNSLLARMFYPREDFTLVVQIRSGGRRTIPTAEPRRLAEIIRARV